MTKEQLAELLKDTYKRTIDDNKEDFQILFHIITKLCAYLCIKDILKEEEVKDILKLDTPNIDKIGE